MLDPMLRRWVDPPLDRAGAWLAERGASAHAVTIVGLAIGLLAVPLLAGGHYGWALVVILLNRLIDGLDGAIARRGSPSLFGGYLDIVCDMAFYAAVPFGFALARPANALWAALLLASFVCTAASFLGRAVTAASAARPTTARTGTRLSFTPPASSRAARPSWRSFCSACSRRPFRGLPACSPCCACGQRLRAWSRLSNRILDRSFSDMWWTPATDIPWLESDLKKRQQNQINS